jgi:hypothetical protein
MIGLILAILPLLDDVLAAEPAIAGLQTIFASQGVAAALATISFADWISIAEKVAAAAPAVQKAWAALHPAFTELVADLDKGLDFHDAAANARAWFSANQPATIPGYAADGGVTQISNPDLKPGE